jgi:hypothetical protein
MSNSPARLLLCFLRPSLEPIFVAQVLRASAGRKVEFQTRRNQADPVIRQFFDPFRAELENGPWFLGV